MKYSFISNIFLSILLLWASGNVAVAQGTYGASSYFNFTYASVSDWSAFANAATFTATVNGSLLTFQNCNSTGPTRSKGGYTGAVRCQSIELPSYPSLGYFSFFAQNGSSGTTRNLYIKIWDNTISDWITVDTIAVGGNVYDSFSPTSVLSKKDVKVKIDSDGAFFWFYQIEAWSSTIASTDANEPPSILSVTPSPGSVVSASGIIDIQLDEIVKAGTGAVTFDGATVTSTYLGNTLQISYNGLTNASNTLSVPANFVQNNGNINLAKDTSMVFNLDVTDPVYQSASPSDGSYIVINDVVQKIILTFDEAIALGPGTISFGPANVTATVSGNTLIIGYSGLAYNTPYTLTVPANMITDISGNTYKNDVVLSYTTYPKDNTPPVLIAQSVADAAINVPIGGSIYLVFNEIVELAGTVSLDGVPVKLSVNDSMIGINYTNLDYDTYHTIDIPAGAITDTTGNGCAGITFTFTTVTFVSKDFDMIVAADGSGDYTSIQSAVNAVPDNSSLRTLIFIKNGIYNEKILIPASKQNLSLIGQDSAKTIIFYNDYAGGAGGTDNSYTIDIKASGFYAENLTIKNTWSTTGGTSNQAVALMTEGDKQVFKNCRFISFQDTHYPKQPNTRNYYLNCYVEGATDFMFGSATAFFDSCRINCVYGGQYCTAPSGTPREFGLVYNNCSITANSNVSDQSYYLGRPWKDYGKTVWINTRMGSHIRDIGWAAWTTTGPDADNQWTGFYAEYNSMDLSGTPINPTRAAWGVNLTSAQAARYDIDNAFNYGANSDTWNPLPFSTEPAVPTNVSVSGNVVSWDASGFAVAYVIFRNDTVISTTTATDYTDASAQVGNNVYKIKAVNEYGAQSFAGSNVATSVKNPDYAKVFGLYPNPFIDNIILKNFAMVKSIEFFNATGILVKQTAAFPVINASELEKGLYIIKLNTYTGESYSIKVIKD